MKFFPCAICTACTAGHKQWENEAAFGEIFSLGKEVFLSLLKFYSESFRSEQMPATFIGMALLTFKSSSIPKYISFTQLQNYKRVTKQVPLLHQTLIQNRKVKTEKISTYSNILNENSFLLKIEALR